MVGNIAHKPPEVIYYEENDNLGKLKYHLGKGDMYGLGVIVVELSRLVVVEEEKLFTRAKEK